MFSTFWERIKGTTTFVIWIGSLAGGLAVIFAVGSYIQKLDHIDGALERIDKLEKSIENVQRLQSADGHQIQLRTTASYIQWRYNNSPDWMNLIELDELRGPPGADGDMGLNGKDGLPGEDGRPGKDVDYSLVQQMIDDALEAKRPSGAIDEPSPSSKLQRTQPSLNSKENVSFTKVFQVGQVYNLTSDGVPFIIENIGKNWRHEYANIILNGEGLAPRFGQPLQFSDGGRSCTITLMSSANTSSGDAGSGQVTVAIRCV